jgi:hypothetical protein
MAQEKTIGVTKQYHPDIRGHVALAILRALSKSPDDRYPNAAEFA